MPSRRQTKTGFVVGRGGGSESLFMCECDSADIAEYTDLQLPAVLTTSQHVGRKIIVLFLTLRLLTNDYCLFWQTVLSRTSVTCFGIVLVSMPAMFTEGESAGRHVFRCFACLAGLSVSHSFMAAISLWCKCYP